MKTRGAAAFSITLIIITIVGVLLAKAIDVDDWILGVLNGAAQSLYVATGYRPLDIFRNVSLASEARTYGEVLASNYYLQIYFVGGGVCAVLSAVFILRANAEPLWRFHAAFVAFLILLLLPVALTTVTYGEIFAARSISYICLTVLILLGLFSCFELMRVKTKGFTGKLAQALVALLVLAQGVILPALYGVKFMWSA